MRETLLMVRVWGEFACFTRPEMKVERVSYPVPTPSAARGVLEAIFWKPEFSWRIAKIAVLRPIRYFSIVRNEINDKQSFFGAQKWGKKGGNYVVERYGSRAQRHTVALRDVDYIISARLVVRPGVQDDAAKFRDQFWRRIHRGQCFARPYLGCREFSASFAPPLGEETPIDATENLGSMLFEIDYAEDRSGLGTPRFFSARLERGVLHVPDLYPEASEHAP